MTPAPVPGTVPTARLLLLLLPLISAMIASPLTLGPPPPTQSDPLPEHPVAAALHQDYYDEEDEGPSPGGRDNDEDEYHDGGNTTEALGSTLGGPCFNSCSEALRHVHCSASSMRCECDPQYPVSLGPTRGCTSPVALGEQCLYEAACKHWDPHARCTQVEHNALCQCEPGFHTVSAYKPHRKSFCSEDLVQLTADLPTLLGVATGIALFTGVICFVLRLFVGGRPRDHFANANLAPSHILFSSDTGSEMSLRQLSAGKMALSLSLCRAGPSRLPLTGHSASRAGSQRSVSLSRGVLVPGMSSSRAGAARAAALLLMSCRQLASDRPETEPQHRDADDNDDDDEDDDDDDENSVDSDDADPDRPPPVPTSTPPPLTPMEPRPPASSPEQLGCSPDGGPDIGSSTAPDTAPGIDPSTAPQSASVPASPATSCSSSPSHRPYAPVQPQEQPRTGQGSRRQSTASVHSSASSAKSMSFGMRRFEREREQRLRRQEQLQQQQQRGEGEGGAEADSLPLQLQGSQQLHTPGSASSVALGSPGTSPNPLSPMSTDKLLPALDQLVEDVVWTTQSSSQRADHLMAMAGSSGYRRERERERERAELRSERARQLHAMHAHLASLHAAHAAHSSQTQGRGACTSPDGR